MNYRDVAHTAAQGKSPQRSLLSYSPVRSPTPVPPGRPLPVQRLPANPAVSPSRIPEKVLAASKGSLKIDAAKVLRSRDPAIVKPKVHLPSALKVDMASVLKNRQKNVKSPIPGSAVAGPSSQTSHPLGTPLAVINENPGVYDKKLSVKSLPPTKNLDRPVSAVRREQSPVSTALSAISVPVVQRNQSDSSPITSPDLTPNVSPNVSTVITNDSPTSQSLSFAIKDSGKGKRISSQIIKPGSVKALEAFNSCTSVGSSQLQLVDINKKSPSVSVGSQALTGPTVSLKSASIKESHSTLTRKSVLSPVKVSPLDKSLTETPEKKMPVPINSDLKRLSPRKDLRRVKDPTIPPKIELSCSSSMLSNNTRTTVTPTYRICTTFSETSSSSTECVLSSNEELKKDKLKFPSNWKQPVSPVHSKHKTFRENSMEVIQSGESTPPHRHKKIGGVSVLSIDVDDNPPLDDECDLKLEVGLELDLEDENFLQKTKSLSDSFQPSEFSTFMSQDLFPTPTENSLQQILPDSDLVSSTINSGSLKKALMDSALKEQTQQLQQQLEEQRQLRLQLEKQQQIQMELHKQQQELQRQLLKMQNSSGANAGLEGTLSDLQIPMKDLEQMLSTADMSRATEKESAKSVRAVGDIMRNSYDKAESIYSKPSGKHRLEEVISAKDKMTELKTTDQNQKNLIKVDGNVKLSNTKSKINFEIGSKKESESKLNKTDQLDNQSVQSDFFNSRPTSPRKYSYHSFQGSLGESAVVEEKPKKNDKSKNPKLEIQTNTNPNDNLEIVSRETLLSKDERRLKTISPLGVKVTIGHTNDANSLKNDGKSIKNKKGLSSVDTVVYSDFPKDDVGDISEASSMSRERQVSKEIKQQRKDKKEAHEVVNDKRLKNIKINEKMQKTGSKSAISQTSKSSEPITSKNIDKGDKQSSKSNKISTKVSTKIVPTDNEKAKSRNEESDKNLSPKYRISVLDMVSKKVRAKTKDEAEIEEPVNINDRKIMENLHNRIIITTDDGVTPKTRSVTVGLEKAPKEMIEKTAVSARRSRSRIKKDIKYDKSFEEHSELSEQSSRSRIKVDHHPKKPFSDSKDRNISKGKHEPLGKTDPRAKKADKESNYYEPNTHESTSGRAKPEVVRRVREEPSRENQKPSKLKGLFNKIDNVVADLESYMEIEPHRQRPDELSIHPETSNAFPKLRLREKDKEMNATMGKRSPNSKVRTRNIMYDDTAEPSSVMLIPQGYKTRRQDNFDDKSMTDAEDRRKKRETIHATARRKTRDDESILRKSTEYPLKPKKTARKESQIDISKPGLSAKQNFNESKNQTYIKEVADEQKQIKAKVIDKKNIDYGNEFVKQSQKVKQETAREVQKGRVTSEIESLKQPIKVGGEKIKTISKVIENEEKKSTKHQDKKGLKEGFGDRETEFKKSGELTVGEKDSKSQKPSVSDEKDQKKQLKKYSDEHGESILKTILKSHVLPKGDDMSEGVKNDSDFSAELDESGEVSEVSCMGDVKQTPEPSMRSLKSESSTSTATSTASGLSNKIHGLSEQSTDQITISTHDEEQSSNTSHFAMAIVNTPPTSTIKTNIASSSVPQSNMVRSVCNLSSTFKRFITSQQSQVTVPRIPEDQSLHEQDYNQEEEFAVAVVTKKSNWMNQNVVVQSLDKISSSLRRLVIGDKTKSSTEQQQKPQQQKQETEEEKIRKLRLQEERKQKIINFQKKLSEKIFHVVKETEPDTESTSLEGEIFSQSFQEMLLKNSSHSDKMQTVLNTPEISMTLITSDSSSGEGIADTSMENIASNFSRANSGETALSSIFGVMSVLSTTHESTESEADCNKHDANMPGTSTRPSHFAIAIVKNENNGKKKEEISVRLKEIAAISSAPSDTKEKQIEQSLEKVLEDKISPTSGVNIEISTVNFEEMYSQPSTISISQLPQIVPSIRNDEVLPSIRNDEALHSIRNDEALPSIRNDEVLPSKSCDASSADAPVPSDIKPTEMEIPFVTLISGSFAINGQETQEISQPLIMNEKPETIVQNLESERQESVRLVSTESQTDSVRLVSKSQIINTNISIDSRLAISDSKENSSNSITLLKLDPSMSAKAGSILSAVLGATGNDGAEEIDQGPSTSLGIKCDSSSNDEYTITILVMEPTGRTKTKRKRPAEHAIDRTLDRLLSSVKTMVNKRKTRKNEIIQSTNNEDGSQSEDGVFSIAMILMDSTESSAEVLQNNNKKPISKEKTNNENKDNKANQKTINMSKITSWSQVKELDSEEFSEVIEDNNVEDNQDTECEVTDDFLDVDMLATELKGQKKKGDRFK